MPAGQPPDQDVKPFIIKKRTPRPPPVHADPSLPAHVRLDVKTARRIIVAREDMRMTQRDLAMRVNKPVTAVQCMEKGEEVERSVVEAVEKVLNVRVL